MFQLRKSGLVALVQVIFWSHVSHCKYLGCFNANSSKHVLNGEYNRSNNMTIKECCNICSSNGSNVYALQYGSYCYCGTHANDYELLGGAPESDCNTPCEGTPTCGGESVMSVYEGKSYLGCYSESTDLFSFGGQVMDLTLEACLERCSNAYRYVGLKQGNKCFCGDRLPTVKSKLSNSDCLDNGKKCQGGDKCGGSGKVAVWTNIADLEKDGFEFVGCYRDKNFQFKQQNKTVEDCAHVCSANYSYAGMNSEGTCFCGDHLPTEKQNIYKTVKLLHSLNGSMISFRFKVLCNVPNNGYLEVWKINHEISYDSCTWSPLQTTRSDDSTTSTTTIDSDRTNSPYKDNEEAIPWLKVYPFLISSFFLGCITVILTVCLSRSYESRRIMMQVRKQLTKQGHNNSTGHLPTPRAQNNDVLTTHADILDDDVAYSSVNIPDNITPYNVAQCTDLQSEGYEEVQKDSCVIESVPGRQYTKVDRQSVSDNVSSSKITEESWYSVPKKPALPSKPPPKIIKESKKKKKTKGKPKQTTGKATSRPTYAPPGIQSDKDMNLVDGTETTNPHYSFSTKSASQKSREIGNPDGGKIPRDQQREGVKFEIQPKNLIHFKKRSMFGSENVTKSVILSQGSDLSSIYSLPHKLDTRPKSSAEVSVKWKNSPNIALDSLGNESKLKNITEHSASRIPEAYDGSNEYSCPNLVDDNPVTKETPSSNLREVANIYNVIDEDKLGKDEMYETIDRQDSPLNVEI